MRGIVYRRHKTVYNSEHFYEIILQCQIRLKFQVDATVKCFFANVPFTSHPFCLVDGKALARQFDGKFIEISAMLAHKVDDVLVSLSREICRFRKRNRHMHDTGCIPQGALGSLRKFFRRESPRSKSEDSIM